MAPQKGVTVASTDFPLYTIHMVGDTHFLVAGGGGQAKTGILNAMQIYGLSLLHGSCIATKVGCHHTTAGAVMNGYVSINKTTKKIVALFGIDGECYAYQLRRVLTPKLEGNLVAGIRKRKGTASHKLVAKTISYDLDPIGSMQTDFGSDGGYQRVVRILSDHIIIVTGGADGYLRVWTFPDLEKLYEVKAHIDEIDDLHINASGNHIVTIGKDNKAMVWKTDSGDKHTELQWKLQKDIKYKYKYRGCRYGLVSDKEDKYCLYTINIPIIKSTKGHQCYITKWNSANYLPEKWVKTGPEILSSLAVCNDAVYLAVGTLSGSVSIYNSVSLQRIYHMAEVHKIFVTGLEFAKSNEMSRAVTGNHDATLFSISADKQIKMHQVNSREQFNGRLPIITFLLGICMIYWFTTSIGL